MVHQPTFSYLEDDALATPEVGRWAETKYRIVGLYNHLFSTGLKKKWNCRVYIDLFAGEGRSRIEGTKHIVPASPLLALSVNDKFDKYIFCEMNYEKLEVLKQRVMIQYPEVNVSYIKGDCNAEADNILKAIPTHSSTKKVLSFCFVDPYNIGIHFETIRKLSEKFMDCLIVLAGGMDANRNEQKYIRPSNKRVDNYLRLSNWRSGWQQDEIKGFSFGQFLAQKYADQMERLGYKKIPLDTMIVVRNNKKNSPLYHLPFFSRDARVYDFWEKVRKTITEQLPLPGID